MDGSLIVKNFPEIKHLATLANRTAALLRTTVRADLAVAELLLGWKPADGKGTK